MLSDLRFKTGLFALITMLPEHFIMFSCLFLKLYLFGALGSLSARKITCALLKKVYRLYLNDGIKIVLLKSGHLLLKEQNEKIVIIK